MKKHFLKKGVAMLGAISLLANVMLPGLQAFAVDLTDNTILYGTETYPYIVNLGSYSLKVLDQSQTYDDFIDSKTHLLSNTTSTSIVDDSWIIIDHTNFWAATQTWLATYYANNPGEAYQDGVNYGSDTTISAEPFSWGNKRTDAVYEGKCYDAPNGCIRNQTTPWWVNAFPWLYVKHTYTEDSVLKIYFDDTLKKTYSMDSGKKSIFMSVPDDLGLTDYRETAGGNPTAVPTNRVRVEYIAAADNLTEDQWKEANLKSVSFANGETPVELTFAKSDGKVVLNEPATAPTPNQDNGEQSCSWTADGYTFGQAISSDIELRRNCTCTANYTNDGTSCVFTVNPAGSDAVVPQNGTTAQGATIASPIDMTTIETVENKNDIVSNGTEKVVLQETKGNSALNEEQTTQPSIEAALTQQVVTDTTKSAEMKGIVDIQFIHVATNGDKDNVNGKVNFNKPVAIKIPVSGASKVRVRVKHNGENTFETSGLTIDSAATCNTANGTVNESAKQYDGGEVDVVSNVAVIYTCGASTFVAYTEKSNQSGASGGGSSGSSGSPAGGSNGSAGSAGSSSSSSTVTTPETSGSSSSSNSVSESTEEKAPVVISDAAKAAYGEEQLAAYQWAYENGITTINDADKARLGDPLTRAELAKMMSQYISSVLKKSPLKTDEPSYSDVKVEELGDLVDFITKAYQYQIMGINADGSALSAFNPFGIVSRGEFATVFSRVLYGDKYNKEGDDFYTNHLAALKEAGVLSVDTPTIQEVRGWVMLMMYRSAQEKAPVAEEENTAEEGTGETVGIANPASTYCVEQGGEVVIKEDADGAQYGVCKLKDGTEVEEWEYYRANHKDEASTGAVAETGSVAETTTGSVAEAATGDAQ